MAIPFYDNLDLKNNKIENVGTPTNNGDAINKQFLDTELDSLHTTISGEVADEISIVNRSIGAVNERIDGIDGEVTTKIDARINTVTPGLIEANIVDSLSSAEANKSLSANQGRILDGRIDAVRDLIVENNYTNTPVIIGTYFDTPLYRVALAGEFEAIPIGRRTVVYNR